MLPTPFENSRNGVPDVLEMHVRRHPELWLWMHRRWRDAPGPALDAAPGMFPAAKADLETDA